MVMIRTYHNHLKKSAFLSFVFNLKSAIVNLQSFYSEPILPENKIDGGADGTTKKAREDLVTAVDAGRDQDINKSENTEDNTDKEAGPAQVKA
jgi:CRISPR/Cas system-associated exonuclease Cas4 (RecB family)